MKLEQASSLMVTLSIANVHSFEPHVLRTIQATTGTPQQIYQTLVTNSTSDTSSRLPRNTERIRNVPKISRNTSRLTRDALFNLHEFASDSISVLLFGKHL